MEFHGIHGIPWNPWNSMESLEFHGIHRIPWNPWNSMDSMEFHGIHGIPWNSMEFHGFHGFLWNSGWPARPGPAQPGLARCRLLATGPPVLPPNRVLAVGYWANLVPAAGYQAGRSIKEQIE